MEAQFLTDQGQIRSRNEDSGGVFYNTSSQLLAIVADGMGGHQAGDVASQMATDLIEQKWTTTGVLTSPEMAEEWLRLTIEEINQKVWQKSKTKKECEGMGTTVVMVICTKEFVTIAHIGDSRCYILNDHGFKQVTEDHSLVNELVRSGQITKTDAESHPIKNVLLKVLGTEETASPDITTLEWEAKNKLLLCSDGLTNKVSDSELSHYLNEDKGIQWTGENLITLANERGGEDNISLAIISYDPSRKVGEGSC